ncbi:hypothetical protein GCM10023347_34170 [Streptomyces chumphonensis]|uniref:Uncharacterized protein n=1 Tax=Streptomyces chumphonensis TaxID=1214925 RepID=A0A927EYR9_9ACTN|nr:hypothetical protein [Streptomyces chumphonensis]MBD3931913.1 hypothetical protein [Streptomyces chumphonensis]
MTAPRSLQRCPDCRQLRDDVRPVALIEANSGPGWTRRACLACVPSCPLDTEPVDRIDGKGLEGSSVNSVDADPVRESEAPPLCPLDVAEPERVDR